MYLVNTGSIQASKNVAEVAKILVEEGIYSSLDMVPIYDEQEIGIEDVYGDIESSLDRVVDRCKALGIELTGNIDYVGDAEGRYLIGQKVESLSKRDLIIRDASVSILLKELERRGVYFMNESSAKPTLVAYDIKWDTDGDKDTFDNLPSKIKIPEEMVDNEEISDYVSDEIGFCHAGFKLGILFRGKIMSYYTNWLDNDTFQMWFGEGIFKDCEGDDYLIELEKHLKDDEWVVEIVWDEDVSTIEGICNADDYITLHEILKIEMICEKIIQRSSDEASLRDEKENSVCKQDKVLQVLEIERMLTISSAHVSQSTRELLDEVIDDTCCVPMPPVYEKSGYGWFVACLPDYDNESLGVTLEDYPADLAAAMRLAKEHGCIWLCIDCDGPEVDELKK